MESLNLEFNANSAVQLLEQLGTIFIPSESIGKSSDITLANGYQVIITIISFMQIRYVYLHDRKIVEALVTRETQNSPYKIEFKKKILNVDSYMCILKNSLKDYIHFEQDCEKTITETSPLEVFIKIVNFFSGKES